MIRITSEEQVVNDQGLRKQIIDEITGNENQRRKDEAFRRNLLLKDKTKVYTIKELLQQFDAETVREMAYSLTNISVARKIIDKLARVYSSGVERKATDEEGKEIADATKSVQETAKLLKMNTEMKRTNRYMRAHRNTMVGVLPCPEDDAGKQLFGIKLSVLQPYHYDVVEQEYDRERAMFVVLSDYNQMISPDKLAVVPNTDGRVPNTPKPAPLGDSIDQKIADSPVDQKSCHYVWWSNKYHFTTNEKGEFVPNGQELVPGVVGSEDIKNPIQTMPWRNFSMDQDGSFWAEGGDDIFDSAVQINCVLSNLQHIGVTQGYGQFWMKGKGLPRIVKTGPNKVILMEQESKDDPDPQLGFASADPKLTELKDLIVMHLALVLSTNNLSTRSVSADLSGSQDFPSGIALILDKAESLEDVTDQQEIFREEEPKIFDLVQRWQELYGKLGLLKDDFKKHMLPQNPKVALNFIEPRVIMSEKEKLEIIELRQKLGINTALELIKIDNPALTEEQAEERLKKILEEKIAAAAQALVNGTDEQNADANPGDEDEGNGGGGQQQQDGKQNRPGNKPPAKPGAKED
jgi:hypothetical protein